MSLQTRLLIFLWAASRSFNVDVIRLNVKGWISCLCRFAQVELKKVSLLNQDILTDLQKGLILIIPKPFIFLAMYLVILSVTEGLFSFKNSSNSLSILFIRLRLKLGITAAIWVNLGRHMVLMTVILPKTVKYLCLQELSSLLTFFKTAVIV